MSDKYTKAIRFREENRDSIDQLDEFVETINRGHDIYKMTLDEKRSLFWFPPGVQVWSNEKYYDNFIVELNTLQIHPPTILSFEKEKVGEVYVLYCTSVMTYKDHTREFVDDFVLVYVDGLWKFRIY